MLLDPLLQPIVIPLVAGLVCLLLPRGWDRPRGWLAVAATGVVLLAAGQLWVAGDQQWVWAGWSLLRLDPLSRFLLPVAATFALLTALYSLSYMSGQQGQRIYWACLLWSLAFASGVLLATEFLGLLICWGLLAVTLYLMIGVSGPEAAEAARKTLIIVGGSDSLLLLAGGLWWAQQGSTRLDVTAVGLDSPATQLAFWCCAAAAFAKAGVIPLHSWLPDCGEKAHAPVTAYLPAALDKLLGIYLLVRVTRDMFVIPDGIFVLLALCGAVTVLGGALMALVQPNLKRLLAYCAVSQVGYILLGIGTGTALGLAAALFHMLNHAIYKSCLFLGAGVVERQTGCVDLDRLGGLATRLPLTFATTLVAALAVAGIPPLNGFASKWMIYQALIDTGREGDRILWVFWLATAMLGSALTLAISVKLLHSVFLCKPSPQIRQARIREAPWSATLPMVVLASLCVLFGIFALTVPLPWLVLPAVGEAVTLPGTWWAGQATALLVVAFLAGWLIYAFTLRQGRLRPCPTYIGGERLDEVRIPGVPLGPERNVEVTGVDFYETVQQLPVLKSLYSMADKKWFDIYDMSGWGTRWLAGVLRGAHTGLLSRYLTWFVAGLLVILYVMMEDMF